MHFAPQLFAHRAAKLAAMLLIRTVHFDVIEAVLRGEEFEMRARLPSAAEPSPNTRGLSGARNFAPTALMAATRTF